MLFFTALINSSNKNHNSGKIPVLPSHPLYPDNPLTTSSSISPHNVRQSFTVSLNIQQSNHLINIFQNQSISLYFTSSWHDLQLAQKNQRPRQPKICIYNNNTTNFLSTTICWQCSTRVCGPTTSDSSSYLCNV